MVFTSADPVRAPLIGSPFDETVQRRGVTLAARTEIARPVPGTGESDSAGDADPSGEIVDAFADLRSRAAARAMRTGERPWTSPDGPRVLRHPAAAPSEAVPALAELQARTSFDPLYLHHQAATRYAFVSALPATPAERRRSSELYA